MDGVLGVSVGLDQRLRTWRLRAELPPAFSAEAQPASRECSREKWSLSEGVSTVVQVLEPAALSVVRDGVHVWHVAVAGRGTQLLRLTDGL